MLDATITAGQLGHIGAHRALHANHNAKYSVADYGSIQAAIDAAQAAGGGCVFVPPGEHRISESLLITASGIHLRGVGRASRIINESADPCVSIVGTGIDNRIANTELEHLWIESSGGDGIYATEAYQIRLFMCGVLSCGAYGIHLGLEVYNTAITHGVIQACVRGGVKLDENVHQVSLMCSRVQGNRGPGIDGRNGRSMGLGVSGNVIEGNRGAAYINDDTSTAQGVTFIGNYFEKNNFYEPKGPHIDLGANGRGYVIIGNYFWGSTSGTATHAVLVRDGSCGIIAANSMMRHTVRDVEIQAKAKQWLVMQIPDLSTADAPLVDDAEGIYHDRAAGEWRFGHAPTIAGDDGNHYRLRVNEDGALYAERT